MGSPALNQSPQGFRSATPAKGWAPVQSPGTPLGPGAQKYFGATPAQQAGSQYPTQGGYQAPGAAYQQPAAQQYQAQPAYQQQPSQQQLYQPPQPSPYQQSQPSQKQLPPQTQQTVAQTQVLQIFEFFSRLLNFYAPLEIQQEANEEQQQIPCLILLCMLFLL